MGTTGQGTTVAFTTAGAVACARSITLPEFSMEVIDSSCLSDTGFTKKIAGDLTDAGEVQVEMVYELVDDIYVPDGVQDTITITFPDAGTTAGSLSGTGFISGNSLPSIEINGLLTQSVTFTFDGQTGPTYTAGT